MSKPKLKLQTNGHAFWWRGKCLGWAMIGWFAEGKLVVNTTGWIMLKEATP